MNNLKNKKIKLMSKTVLLQNLDKNLIEEAFVLYQFYYEEVSFDAFKSDFLKKDKVILVYEKTTNILRGFSTLLVKKVPFNNKEVIVIYSGDTIVDEDYRGTRALTSEFFKNIVLERLKNPLTEVWWFLISKGYKTYLLLANNYNHYYPCFNSQTPKLYQGLLDDISSSFFEDRYNKETGIISFEGKHERLKDFTAPITDQMMEKYPRIKFFQESNPNWKEGEELACIGEVNWRLFYTYPYKLIKKRILRPKKVFSNMTI